ncbi:MAG: IclR family transcriptional regulator [Rubrobacteraceae bacterium]
MNVSGRDRDGYQVRAVLRAAAILELLRTAEGGASLKELASRSGLAKASAFRLLRTLECAGLVERTAGPDIYKLGVRCLALGQAYLEQTDLRREALPFLERLREEFDETVHLGVMDGEMRVVYLEKLETRNAVGLMMSRVGKTAPSFCTGVGKALLSGMSGDPVSTLEEKGVLRRYTPGTIYDPEELREELSKIRDRGFALDMEEHEAGVRCVACPITGPNRTAVAAVSIAGPSHRLPERLLEGELADAVVVAAREISHRLGSPTA